MKAHPVSPALIPDPATARKAAKRALKANLALADRMAPADRMVLTARKVPAARMARVTPEGIRHRDLKTARMVVLTVADRMKGPATERAEI